MEIVGRGPPTASASSTLPTSPLAAEERPTVVEFALRTFALGLFAKDNKDPPALAEHSPDGSANASPRRSSVDALHSEDPSASAEHGLNVAAISSDSLPSIGTRDDAWERVEEPREISGGMGFTTLACGGGNDRCLSITPEGDVHCWAVEGRGVAALSRGFCMDWSLSVLKDDAGQRMQLRDIALGWPTQPVASPTHPASSSCSRGDGDSNQDRGDAGIGAIALMDSGDVYTAEAPSSACWQAVPCLQSLLVVSVSCGSGFCLALTAGGELWAWGESEYGALGIGSSESAGSEADTADAGTLCAVRRAASPTLVRGALARTRVAVMACGEHHAIAATLDEPEQPGRIFSWGCGHGCGARLGFIVEEGIDVGAAEPQEIEWISPSLAEALIARRELSSTQAGGPRQPGSPEAAEPRRRGSLRTPQRVTQLGCGARHSAVLCQGSIICFGEDDHGQLGAALGSPPSGIDLPAFASTPALRVPAGCVGAGGTAASRGGRRREEASPDTVTEWIEAASRQLCCGALHTAAVSTTGHLHVWGRAFKAPQSPPGVGGGVWPAPGFGTQRPVVALACGAHFVLASAEVELPISTQQPADVSYFEMEPSSHQQPARCWRPANLPLKTFQESMKHETLVRELERNIQRKFEREQEEDRQRLVREERREQKLKEHTEIWMTELLPSYVQGCPPPRRMEMFWRQGLPPLVREVLWPLAIGNGLRITPELFEIYSRQAADAKRADEAPASGSPRRNHGRESSTKIIPLDLHRTFPTLAFFAEGGPLNQDCTRILEAYTFFRPDVGYVQGMSYLAAMLLLYLPVYPAFVGLCNLINTPSVLGLYRLEPQAVECRALLFRRFCAMQMPILATRLFEEVDLRPELFLIEWFMTLFSKCLSIDVASVVWDLFFLDGEVVLYCTALALLRICEERLLSNDGLDLEGCVKILGKELRERASDPDEVLYQVHEVWRRAPPQLLAEIRNIENTEFSATSWQQCANDNHTSRNSATGSRGMAPRQQGCRAM